MYKGNGYSVSIFHLYFSGLTQQCCYNEEGTLSFRTGRPFIGTPLYVDKSGLVTYLQSTLRKIYCCIEGTNTKRCSALERLLSPSDGSGYKVPSPGICMISTKLTWFQLRGA